MKRVTATQARQQLFRLLDEAELGEEIMLERNGVRFRIVLDKSPPIRTPQPSPLIITDPEVLDGQWTWVEDHNGELTFKSRA